MTDSPRKLDLPVSSLDDWDLLQAAFEANISQTGRAPGIDPEYILNQEFPVTQSKAEQEARLKRMLSQRNAWNYQRKPHAMATPPAILQQALVCIQAECHLSQQKTMRQLLIPFMETSTPITHSPIRASQPVAWTTLFCRDFWEFIADLKIQGQSLLPQPKTPSNPQANPKPALSPGEQRTLMALQQAAPTGLTVAELCQLTRKDTLSEETPRGSQDTWLKALKDRKLIQADTQRPKHWFIVTNLES